MLPVFKWPVFRFPLYYTQNRGMAGLHSKKKFQSNGNIQSITHGVLKGGQLGEFLD